MPKPMKTREVVTALLAHGCLSRQGKGSHEVWTCPCGQHQVSLPTGHRVQSPGMVGKAIKSLTCLPKGWLQ